jgi:hypothetical protein
MDICGGDIVNGAGTGNPPPPERSICPPEKHRESVQDAAVPHETAIKRTANKRSHTKTETNRNCDWMDMSSSHFTWFSSVPPEARSYSVSSHVTTASFHIPAKSLFIIRGHATYTGCPRMKSQYCDLKQKVYYMYMCPIPNGFRDRAMSLCSSKTVDNKEILRTLSNTGIYCSCDKVGTLYLV